MLATHCPPPFTGPGHTGTATGRVRPPKPHLSGRLALVGGALLAHVALLWALQAGLLRRVVEVVVPVQWVGQAPVPVAPPPQPVPTPRPLLQPQRSPAPPAPAPAPATAPAPSPAAALPLAVAGPASPSAPTGAAQPAAPVPAPVAAAAPAPAPAPAAPKDEAPLFTADYLHNPAPAYPPMSRKLGERGQVLVRVLVGEDGQAQTAELKTGSGFERLDRAALNAVLKWRYVPGKRAGVAQAMWVVVPINFGLE